MEGALSRRSSSWYATRPAGRVRGGRPSATQRVSAAASGFVAPPGCQRAAWRPQCRRPVPPASWQGPAGLPAARRR
eukprot:5417103-Lingulodinium_polyedra.AAC.1